MKRPEGPGPLDLRLVVPAMAAWAAAALALDAPAGWAAAGAGLGVLGAGLLLLAACRRPEPLWRIGTAAAAALLCAAAGAGVAGLQRAGRGPGRSWGSRGSTPGSSPSSPSAPTRGPPAEGAARPWWSWTRY